MLTDAGIGVKLFLGLRLCGSPVGLSGRVRHQNGV